MLLRFLLLAVLVLFAVRAVWRLLEGVAEGASGGRGRRGRAPDRGTPMVRDPVCGTYVVQSRALTAERGGETAFFCSDRCRREWQAGGGRRARAR
jgi:YHS domain-containing protein